MSDFFFQPNSGGGGGGGLVQETQSILNNQTNTSITSLIYDKTLVIGAQVSYMVNRGTDTLAEKIQQIGTLVIRYDANTDDWFIADGELQGDAGTTFTITSGGQVQYTSSNLAGANYFGNIYFYDEQITL